MLTDYSLTIRQPDFEALYPGAEVWQATHRDDSRPLTIITYRLSSPGGTSRTARALWSAELRKLFRLSCLPFDASMIGFVTGGFKNDDAGGQLVLVMEDSLLPNVQGWLSEADGKQCANQWRGTHTANRAELWEHIAGLFRALASMHESRIVHRRIMPANILVDVSLSRDQSGFLKLGRFEASTFFHAAKRLAAPFSTKRLDPSHLWYNFELQPPSTITTPLSGTPAGDVYSLLTSALWLCAGKPDGQDLNQFAGSLTSGNASAAADIRKAVTESAIQALQTPEERSFFALLNMPRFPIAVTAAQYHDEANAVIRHMRRMARDAGGPLHISMLRQTEDAVKRLYENPTLQWQEWLCQACRAGRFVVSEHDEESAQHRGRILLPNGWTLIGAIFRSSSGRLDWNRFFIQGIKEFGGTQQGISVPLNTFSIQILSANKLQPTNARSWRGLFDQALPPQTPTVPAQKALDVLNFAELSFWEEHVVPVRVTNVKEQWTATRGEELVEIEQLFGDAEFPINPPIRQKEPPDFATILQDKRPPIEVELSDTSDLWDRERQQERWIEPLYFVREIPERAAGPARTLRLSRAITRNDSRTILGWRGYFKTKDQGWQMGLFRRRRQAVDLLSRHAILADVLRNPAVRQRRVEPPPLSLSYEPWSEEKNRLVSNTLATAPLFLVQGPPGTGKSTFVAGLMRFILSQEEDPSARILVVAQMHSAIDELATKVQTMFEKVHADGSVSPLVLRLRSPRDEVDEARADREMTEKSTELLHSCAEAIEGLRTQPPYDAIYNALLLEIQRPSEEFLDRLTHAANIVFTTCTDRHLDQISRTEFDWVIIEEAGRLVGSDLVIPMRLGHRWILIGDPNQLGPYRREDFREVVSRLATEQLQAGQLSPLEKDRLEVDCHRLLGPFETLFESLPFQQKEKLTQQHRMHPQIRQVVSHVFYQRELTDDAETAGKIPFLYNDDSLLSQRAVIWLDVPHRHWPNGHTTVEQREPEGFSYSNASELDLVRRFLTYLDTHRPDGISAESTLSFAALAPYKLQVNELKKLLRSHVFPDWLEIVPPAGTFTATAFQGREADIVLLSMVRNNLQFDAGFLDRKQLNVSLSRARRLLVVVGCFEMLKMRAESGRSQDDFVRILVDELSQFVVPAPVVFPEVLR